jgi:Sec-independent protein translocase protein TatA
VLDVGSLDPAKILVILVLALVVLGPERLPKVARQAGAAWRELTRVRDQVTEEIRSAIPDVDLPTIPKMPKNMVSGFISDLTKPSVQHMGGDAVGADAVESEVHAPADELRSSSSSGHIPDEGIPGSVLFAETMSAGSLGDVPMGWESSNTPDAGAGRGRRVGNARVDDLPVTFDDASMN